MLRRGCFSIRDGFCRVPATLVALFLLPCIAAAQESSSLLMRSGRAIISLPSQVRDDARRITLADAQQLAQAATDPLVRLGRLQVEAAEEHRKGVRSMYFPSVSTQFFAVHFTQEPGELLTFQRPVTGALISVPIAVFFQNQNVFNVVATQPITQLLSIRQLVKIARADENIARAKAGMPMRKKNVDAGELNRDVGSSTAAAATRPPTSPVRRICQP